MNKEILYGKNAVLEAIKSGRKIYHLTVSSEVLKKEGSLRQAIREQNIPHDAIDAKKLKQVAHKKYGLSGQFQGIIAEVEAYAYLELETFIEILNQKVEPPFILMLDGLEDVHNLGAILRSAEAVGVDGIIIPKKGNVQLNSTVARLSAGAIEYVPVVQVANLTRSIERLKEEGVWFFAADIGNSEDYRRVDFKPPTCLVIGSEGRGISRLVKEACDFKIHLPMVGNITSLNASVAAAVLMYEVFNQRHPK